MIKWQDCSEQNLQIILPAINPSPWNVPSIEAAQSELVFPVSLEFGSVWKKGPHSDSVQDLLDALVVLGKTFSQLICFGQNRTRTKIKTSPTDLVTEIDAGVEMLFRIWINRFFPHHKIIGEEGNHDLISPTDFVWYIDPVDGTHNYVHQIPFVGINMGCLKAGKPYVSFVGKPFEKEYFYACDEGPVFKETEKEKVQLTPQLNSTTIIGTEYRNSPNTERKFNSILKNLNAKSFECKSITVNLASLLEGKTTAFYKSSAKAWDIIAPAMLINRLYSDQFCCEIIFLDTKDEIDLFSNSERLIGQLNRPDNPEKRTGLCLIYPKSRPDIKRAILHEYE